MKLQKGHEVQIICGKYKGLKGKVLSICKKTSRITVENCNMKTKHVKPKQNDEKGYIKQIEGMIHKSNIKISTTKT
uniref:Large ribosomal subunit protein uL24c n=1 Tax=Erythrocystis saccata TaxID=2822695 RepID=A0A8E6P023_9FLOR|nr:ribosomal protein L24 [Erythrocystis saccata]